jgi:transcriptional regulator with XRE-family HTH domain
MAERVGLDRRYLAEVETGEIEICMRNLELVAQAFNLELHQLLTFPAKSRS